MSGRRGDRTHDEDDDEDDAQEGHSHRGGAHASTATRQRLDKWLWAARFFRTRAQAKQAIDGGKVSVGDTRAKPAKEVSVGDLIHVRRGDEQFVVEVRGLSEQRGGAPAAQLLYAETEQSRAAREAAREQRRRGGFGMIAPPTRPTKRDRRALDRLHEAPSDDE